MVWGGEMPGSPGAGSAAPGAGASWLARPPRLSPPPQAASPGNGFQKKSHLKKGFGRSYPSSTAAAEPHAKCFLQTFKPFVNKVS